MAFIYFMVIVNLLKRLVLFSNGKSANSFMEMPADKATGNTKKNFCIIQVHGMPTIFMICFIVDILQVRFELELEIVDYKMKRIYHARFGILICAHSFILLSTMYII